MNDVVVPICDPADAAWAAAQAISLYRTDHAHIHLLNVQRPLPRHVAQFFNRDDLRAFHEEAGTRVLERAVRMLDDAGVPHEDHVLVGHPAETIVRFADDLCCRQVIVDTPARSVFTMLGLGSIGSQVAHLMQANGSPQGSATGASRAS